MSQSTECPKITTSDQETTELSQKNTLLETQLSEQKKEIKNLKKQIKTMKTVSADLRHSQSESKLSLTEENLLSLHQLIVSAKKPPEFQNPQATALFAHIASFELPVQPGSTPKPRHTPKKPKLDLSGTFATVTERPVTRVPKISDQTFYTPRATKTSAPPSGPSSPRAKSAREARPRGDSLKESKSSSRKNHRTPSPSSSHEEKFSHEEDPASTKLSSDKKKERKISSNLNASPAKATKTSQPHGRTKSNDGNEKTAATTETHLHLSPLSHTEPRASLRRKSANTRSDTSKAFLPPPTAVNRSPPAVGKGLRTHIDLSEIHQKVLACCTKPLKETRVFGDLPRLSQRVTLKITKNKQNLNFVPDPDISSHQQTSLLLKALIQEFEDKELVQTVFKKLDETTNHADDAVWMEEIFSVLGHDTKTASLVKTLQQDIIMPTATQLKVIMFSSTNQITKDVRTLDGWQIEVVISDDCITTQHCRKETSVLPGKDHFEFQWKLLLTLPPTLETISKIALHSENLSVDKNFDPTILQRLTTSLNDLGK